MRSRLGILLIASALLIGGLGAAAWWVGSAVGIAFGGTIPDSWQIQFAFPLMFIALLVPTLRNRPAIMAALVGAAVTLAAKDLPNGLNVCLGAVAGVTAGSLVPTGEEAA